MNDVSTKSWDLEVVLRASRFAAVAHDGQVRKETQIPYLSHLWAVASLVMENDGTDSQVAAALLHDVVEDCGGQPCLDEVREEFGDEVADMVEALSDSIADAGAPKAEWKIRKTTYLEKLRSVGDTTALVSASDKLHNLRSIVSDYREKGPELWDRFNRKDPLDHRWYYESLIDILEPKVPAALGGELRRTFEQLEVLLVENGEDPESRSSTPGPSATS